MSGCELIEAYKTERLEKLADLVQIVVDDYAAAQKRICELEAALVEIESIRWGYDGDCGTQAIIDRVKR